MFVSAYRNSNAAEDQARYPAQRQRNRYGDQTI
jgi:hypothetical protein